MDKSVDVKLGNEPLQDVRDKKDLYAAVEQTQLLVTHDYLSSLENFGLIPLNSSIADENNEDVSRRIQLYRIEKLVYDKNESFLEKCTTVLNSAYTSGGSLLAIVKSDGSKVEYLLGAVDKSVAGVNAITAGKNLSTSLTGNFIGSEVVQLKQPECLALIERIERQTQCNITAISGCAALRDKLKDSKQFVQGIENMVNTLRGSSYTLMIIADPVTPMDLAEIKAGYENIYTQLSQFAKTELGFNSSDGKSTTVTISDGTSQSISKSTAKIQSHTDTTGWTKSTTDTIGGSFSTTVNFGGKGVGGNATAQVNASHASQKGENGSQGDTSGTAVTEGSADGSNHQLANSDGVVLTNGQSLQMSTVNKTAENILKLIDAHLERLNLCESFGAFNTAAYVISNNVGVNGRVASAYQALMRGEHSYLQGAAINHWAENSPNIDHLNAYLRHFTHPQFHILDVDLVVSPALFATSQELALQVGLPKKSLPGLPVVEMAPFGRNQMKYSGMAHIEIGQICHMGQVEKTSMSLSRDSLTAHTFITGSTGAGKSNAIYTLLDRLCLSGKSDTHFLVIEPAKGEYKDTLGGYKGVSVYGTNPKKTQLLRLNPFAFPEDIHVLEHIDRLIEIFNACWPMYAAMPAVLKSAVENAYSNVGWSLNASSNPSGRVPTFRDVMDALPQVIRTKGFSKDTQGDYEGALLTRVESLTNGINGQVLCSCDPVQDEALFDENVIVDLSRVGSMETKALLMGILVLKLQEHRMAQRSAGKNKPNSGLAHITVLEEAHNLLRRTSSEQSQESANLQGKSVEMLTNAIAELRSFGEGFVIADQSPGLLDMAVIRNTNTKIIMRLPDEGDRQLVGRAAGLNDDQIVELSKLETGVAAIYQNEWLEPVLCKVDRFGDEKVKPFDYKKQPPDAGSFYPTMFSLLCGQTDYCELTKEQVDAFYRWVERISIREELKETLCTAIENKKQVPNPDATLYVLVSGDTLFKATSNETPTDTIAQRLMERYQMDNLELVRLMSEHLVDMQIRLGRMEQTASSIEKMPGERWR